MRIAAVMSLAKLAAGSFTLKFLEMLADPLTGRIAGHVRGLLPNARDISVTKLQSLLRPENPFYIRKHAFRLLERLGKWVRLPALLEYNADSDPKILKLAQDALRRWLGQYNRDFSTPTRAQIEEARRFLTERSGRLSSSVVRE